MKSQAHESMIRKLVRAGFFLSVLNLLGGALGYVFQILMGRLFQPSEYALYSAIMALIVIFGSPVGAITLVISRQISNYRAKLNYELIPSYFIRIAKKLFLYAAILAPILFLILLDYVKKYTKSEEDSPIIMMFVILVLSAFYSINLAFFQGLQKFNWYGLLGLLGLALKIFFSCFLVWVGFGVAGGLGGIVLAISVTLGIGLIGLRYVFNGMLHSVPPSSNRYEGPVETIYAVLPVLIANTAFVAMTQMDVVFVNWYFSAELAGVYAAAAILGKAALFLPNGLVMALFPMVAENNTLNKDTSKILISASLLTFLMSILVSLAYWLFGDFLLYILFGGKYSEAAPILKWFGFVITPLSLVLIAEQYLIAKRKTLFCWLFLAALPVEFLAIHYWHSNLYSILYIVGSFGLVLLILGYLIMWRMYRVKSSQQKG
jgi:O-antigen/teichoic acid export membrane protein